ncbi:MAG TPA: hypothetical protein DEF51_12025 [Myxococcales bacterium]|nr:hypothetical protein [Myxococcales bacterium]
MTRDGRSEVFFSPFATGRWVGPAGEHFDGTRFRNQVDAAHESLGGVMKWMLNREPGRWQQIHATPGPKPPLRVRDGLRVTFVNHATFLLQLGGLNVLTDPVWGERTSPVGFAGPKRFRPPGIRFEDLPPIDVVLVSHNHYDHMDFPTLRRLAARDRPRILVGLGNAGLLRESGVEGGEDLDWDGAIEVAPGVRVHGVPVHHSSRRGLGDADVTLWLGFVLEGPSGRVYYAGDTAFGPHFAEVEARFGAPRLAILPIGAYRPRRFLARMHMSPEEAARAHRALRAEESLGVHWGTFQLSDEGRLDPLRDLRAALRPGERFYTLAHGAAREVPRARVR